VALAQKTAEHTSLATAEAAKLHSALRIFVAETARIVSNKGLEIIMGSETVNDTLKNEYIEKLRSLDLVGAEQNIINEMDKILL